MRLNHKINGFILLETLIAMSIIAIALGLFWQARLFQIDVDARLVRDYTHIRLSRDVVILQKLDVIDALSSDGYAPFYINVITETYLQASSPDKTTLRITFGETQ